MLRKKKNLGEKGKEGRIKGKKGRIGAAALKYTKIKVLSKIITEKFKVYDNMSIDSKVS